MSRLAIFDCDGTLVDSAAPIYAAIADSFQAHGLKVPPPSECKRVIGLSLVRAMESLVPEHDDPWALAESYKRSFSQARLEGRVEEPLFPGIAELLDRLEGDGWLLAVATGKSDRGLNLCLGCHGFESRFVSLQTGDRHPSKPHPSMVLAAMAEAGASPEGTVVIGDTAFDMGMATAAGVRGVGAGWGYHEREELLAAGAVGVAQEPLEVLALIGEETRSDR